VLVPLIISDVNITPPTATLIRGQTQQFSAVVVGQNNPPQDVSWTVTGGGTGTSINGSGLLTVGSNQTEVNLTVKATSMVDPTKNASVIVKVVSVTSVVVSPNTATLLKGATQQFNAVLNGINNPPTDVIWGLTGSTNAGTTITTTGFLTVASSETATSLSITATSVIDPTKNGTATVSVISVTNVVVSPSTANVPKGQTQLFTAEVIGTNNPPQDVNWAVIGGVAGTGIDPGGHLTVAGNETANTLTVRATSVADPTKSGETTVTVSGVSSVTVNPTTAPTLSRGETQQFTATVSGTNNPPQTVNWAVTGGVAGTNINSEGLLTVANNETATSLTVTATSTTNNVSGNRNVYVRQVTGVSVTPANASLARGQTQQYTATVTGNYTPISQAVTWSVTGGATGTNIDEDGFLTVASDETATSLTVTATSTYDNTKSDNASVSVSSVASIDVTPNLVSVNQGQIQQFNAVVNGNNNPSQAVTWVINSNNSGTIINTSGLLTLASNEAATLLTVTATSVANPNISGTASVNVTTVTSIDVTPSSIYLLRNTTQQFTAVVNGTNEPSQDVTWSVAGGSGVYINPSSGVLWVYTTSGYNTFTVTATSVADPNKSGTATVDVCDISSVSVEPTANLYLNRGDTQQFTATVSGTNNPPQTVNWAVTGGVAGTTINEDGLLTVANIETATSLNVRATSTVSTGSYGTKAVYIRQVTSVTVEPSTAVILSRGVTQQYTATVNGTTGISQAVTWVVTGGVAGTTINADGLLTVASNETATSLIIAATSTYDDTKSGSMVPYISQVMSVVVTPASVYLSIGETRQYTATVNVINSAPTTVNWTVTGSTASTTFSSSGLLLVAIDEEAEVLTVTATSTYDNTKSDSATVNVLFDKYVWEVTDTTTWNAAVSGIISLGSNRTHTINLNDDFYMTGYSSNTFGSLQGIIVLIQGEHTISLGALGTNNGSLLRIGNQQTVILKDVTLQGKNNNNASLCYVSGTGAVFRMEGDASIQGNSVSGYNGAGVYIDGSTFIMQGSASISGNTNTWGGYHGSGVYVAGGSLTISGNASISGNTTTSWGGGVYITSSSTFTMEGNASISGNTAGTGGGVYVANGGTFRMLSGTISANSASSHGGGVYVVHDGSSSPNGTFIKSGGSIYGSDAQPNLRNIAGSIGYVALRNYSAGEWRNLTAGPSDNTTSNNFWTGD